MRRGGRDYDAIEKTAPFAFDVGEDGAKVGEVRRAVALAGGDGHPDGLRLGRRAWTGSRRSRSWGARSSRPSPTSRVRQLVLSTDRMLPAGSLNQAMSGPWRSCRGRCPCRRSSRTARTGRLAGELVDGRVDVVDREVQAGVGRGLRGRPSGRCEQIGRPERHVEGAIVVRHREPQDVAVERLRLRDVCPPRTR